MNLLEGQMDVLATLFMYNKPLLLPKMTTKSNNIN